MDETTELLQEIESRLEKELKEIPVFIITDPEDLTSEEKLSKLKEMLAKRYEKYRNAADSIKFYILPKTEEAEEFFKKLGKYPEAFRSTMIKVMLKSLAFSLFGIPLGVFVFNSFSFGFKLSALIFVICFAIYSRTADKIRSDSYRTRKILKELAKYSFTLKEILERD